MVGACGSLYATHSNEAAENMVLFAQSISGGQQIAALVEDLDLGASSSNFRPQGNLVLSVAVLSYEVV